MWSVGECKGGVEGWGGGGGWGGVGGGGGGVFFFFNDTATTEIYTLSLHDALPIFLTFSAGTRLVKIAIFSLKVFGFRF